MNPLKNLLFHKKKKSCKNGQPNFPFKFKFENHCKKFQISLSYRKRRVQSRLESSLQAPFENPRSKENVKERNYSSSVRLISLKLKKILSRTLTPFTSEHSLCFSRQRTSLFSCRFPFRR